MTKLLALGALLAGTAIAQADTRPSCDEQGPQQLKFHIEKVDGRPTTVIENQIIICKQVPRPSVSYVLQAKHMTYAWELLPALDFMPLVLATVHKAPF